MITTYRGWVRALKKKYPEAYIEGNKDIAQAFNKSIGVGEWDGAVGFVKTKIEIQVLAGDIETGIQTIGTVQ